MIFFYITGHGVFTTKSFKKCEFLLEYVGERIDSDNVSDERSCYLYGFLYGGKKIWYVIVKSILHSICFNYCINHDCEYRKFEYIVHKDIIILELPETFHLANSFHVLPQRHLSNFDSTPSVKACFFTSMCF